MEEAIDEDGPLEAEGGHHEVKTHRAEAIPLQEHHEEAEADEDHDVNILEHCGGREKRVVRREGDGERGGVNIRDRERMKGKKRRG